MVGAAVAAAPRYAPPDPTLPHPWRALVDGNTGYIYYWNPETNITQYDKPLPLVASGPPLPAGPPPALVISGPKLAAVPNGADQLNGGNGHMAGLNGYVIPNQQPKLAAIPVPRGAQVGCLSLPWLCPLMFRGFIRPTFSITVLVVIWLRLLRISICGLLSSVWFFPL